MGIQDKTNVVLTWEISLQDKINVVLIREIHYHSALLETLKFKHFNVRSCTE